MALFRGQSRPTLLATALGLAAAVFAFSASLHFAAWGAGAPLQRTPAPQLGAGPRRAPDSSVGAGLAISGSASLLFAAVAATALTTKLLRSSVQRRGLYGFRDRFERAKPIMEGRPTDFVVNYIPGQTGYKQCYIDPHDSKKRPARMSLSQIHEAMAEFRPTDFNKAPAAPLSVDSVKEVATYMTKEDDPSAMTVPAQFTEYKKPPRGIRMEKEPGEKRPPTAGDAYVQYIEKRFGLYDAAKQVASSALNKDIICERTTLMLLLEYLDGNMTPELMARGQHLNSVDLMRITKNPGGKGLVFERLFEKKNLWAEFRPYRGGWKRSEVSNRGSFTPAWERLCSGDKDTQSMMITGLWQVAGSKAGGIPDPCYRFVEFEMGGLSFLSRARAHAKQESKNVELTHKNWYFQDQVTALKTYWKMLLGKTDLYVMGLHRSGKLIQVVEATTDGIVEKQPAVVEAAERRLGRLVELIKQVQQAVADGGDGPWVLQWQRGRLLLGKYEKVQTKEKEEVMVMA